MPLLPPPELRPLPRAALGAACGCCDKAQARWTFRTPICAVCVFREATFDPVELAAEVERYAASVGRTIEVSATGGPVQIHDADVLLGRIALAASLAGAIRSSARGVSRGA